MVLFALVFVLALCVTGFGSTATAQQIIYVTESGGNDGSSWNDSTDLQDALDQATGDDVIVIAEGVYTPGSSRDDRFEITGDQDGLQIYGGWDGTESFSDADDVIDQLDDRDLTEHVTVLSGDIDGSDDTNADGVTEHPDDISGDNSYHVLFFDGTDTGPLTDDTVLDGVTVTAGQADDSFGVDSEGGGLYCDGSGSGNSCNPRLAHIHFAGNTANNGGAVYSNGQLDGESSPLIEYATFHGNQAMESGGAMFNDGGRVSPSNAGISNPTTTNTVFTKNTANIGGAVFNSGQLEGESSPQFINTVFVDNTADLNGGAMVNTGRNDGTSSPSFTNVTFTRNQADNIGGALRNIGINGTSEPTFENTILWENTAEGSSVTNEMSNGEATPHLTHTLIEGGCDDLSGASCGDNNLDEDPRFVDADNPAGDDDTFGTETDGLRLSVGSPAINAGNNNALPADLDTDLVGEDRIQDGTVSLGPYETPLYNGPIFYVNASASGIGDGSSFDDAFPDLEEALDRATGDDVIVIAADVYTPTRELESGDPRSAAFEVTGDQDGLQIYGGWDGTESFSEVDDVLDQLDDRDLTENVTVLSGDLEGTDDTNADGVTEHPDDINGDNSYNVFVFNGGNDISDDITANITTTTILDGVTITGGNADKTFGNPGLDANKRGAGIYCDGKNTDNECSPQISHITLMGNRAIGDVLFNFGAALYNTGLDGGKSSPHILRSTFQNNIADQGGAIFNRADQEGESSPKIEDVLFIGNEAQNAGGAIFNRSDTDGESSPEIVNTVFVDNTTDAGGGAILNAALDGESDPLIVSSLFVNNTAERGGAIGSQSSGDGVLTPDIINTTFVGNNATEEGGAIFNFGGGDETINSQLANSILWDNSAGNDGDAIVNLDNVTTTLSHTLIEGGVNGPGVAGEPNEDEGNNLDEDPQFVDLGNPAGDDDTFGTEDDGLRLLISSPAVNAGDNDALPADIDTDLLGEDRIQGGTVSLGPYERSSFPYEGPIFYVDANASGGDGSSFDDAFSTLQTALDIAEADDAIVMAGGTYTPTRRLDSDNERTATFEVTGDQDGLHIYGGWSGTESFNEISDIENALDTRDFDANETMLSGQIGDPDTSDDNLHHVVLLNAGETVGNDISANITHDTHLDGVTITKGGGGIGFPENSGAGLFCDGSGSTNECSPQITNVRFADNRATYGSAIYNSGFNGTSNPQITHSTFTDNTADEWGGAIYNFSGGGGESSPEIAHATFDNNTADTGGAIFNDGFDGTSSPTIAHAMFTNNTADFGGALFNDGFDGVSNPKIVHVTFSGNTADDWGGAIYNSGRSNGEGNPQIANALFVDNEAELGAAVFNDGNNGESSPQLTNATFTSNTATEEEGGIVYSRGENGGTSTPTLINTILWANDIANDGPVLFNSSATSTVEFSLIQDGCTSLSSTTCENGNLDEDPLFADADNPSGNDDTFGTFDDGLRLVEDSPAVDAGDNRPFESGAFQTVTTDLGGDDRIQDITEDGNATVNMGAYETPGFGLVLSRTIDGATSKDNSGWRIVGLPYAQAEAGDLRFTHSEGTTTPRFNRNLLALWDDGADNPDDPGSEPTGDYIIGDSDTQLESGTGFLLFLEDDNVAPVDDMGLTVSLDGTPTSGLQEADPVTRNDLSETARWHLLANPHPTDYELAALQSSGNALTSEGFHLDAHIYNAEKEGWTLVDTEQDTLAAWQGFFIERSNTGDGATSVTFDPDGRTAPSAPFIGSMATGPAPTADVNRGTLWLEGIVADADGTPVVEDQALGVRFHEHATDGWDPYDASKLAPLNSPFVSLRAIGTGPEGDDVPKAVESRPWPQDPSDPAADITSVPVEVVSDDLPDDGTLTMQVREWDLPDTWAAELVDTQGTASESDNEVVPLDPGMSYTIDVSSLNDDPETERFLVQIAPNETALPVELAEFEATLNGDAAVLQWQTASETNNAEFEVQRTHDVDASSPEGASWESITSVEGAGTTDEPQSYRFEDTQLPYEADSLSYRLRQIDTDGTESFSEAVTVARQVTHAELLPTYPNPVRGQATVRYAVPDRQEVRIDLYDVLGRRVQTVVHDDAEGRTEDTLDVSRLASGTYFLRMRTDGHTETQRLTVVR